MKSLETEENHRSKQTVSVRKYSFTKKKRGLAEIFGQRSSLGKLSRSLRDSTRKIQLDRTIQRSNSNAMALAEQFASQRPF